MTMLQTCLVSYRTFLQRLPPSQYTDFCRWVLQPTNPLLTEFLHLSSLTQMCSLFTYLYGPATNDTDRWDHLCAEFSSLLLYQRYEVVSDNLAMGLALTSAAHGEVVTTFNSMLIDVLTDTAPIALPRLQQIVAAIPWLEQHLAADHYRAIVQAFRPDADLEAWVALSANIVACRDVLSQILHPAANTRIRQTLIARYYAMNTLCSPGVRSIQELLALQTATMLVIPTLEYCVNLWSQIYLDDYTAQHRIATDPKLRMLINDANSLVRCLNDCGPLLLSADAPTIAQHYQRLYQSVPAHDDEDWITWFVRAADRVPHFFRLHKDVAFREFNLLFAAITAEQPIPSVIEQLIVNTQTIAQHYQIILRHFETASQQLSQTPLYSIPVGIITRMVSFHQQLYANHYGDIMGEYAVAAG
ncbi:hypothetical protein [Herpetosiphon llansteffanensis]|uniref:hypothetical protein n=1 Tax=Herpetosiphon llansteffanensis TaxID=2094568 RepID=UPI000F51A63D|nr:hypothetical protein [Herpetosiphon llansteffanensis]